jgi:sugar/nucleoside kinase (ribokinase family)
MSNARKLSSSLRCVVIGDIFFDVIVKMNDESPLIPGGTCYSPLISMVPGGSGNVATALSTLGVKSAFVGKAGRDILGKLYVSDLKSYGVEPHVFFESRYSTGVMVTVVHSYGERSFIVARGANDILRVSEIEQAASSIRDAFCVYVSGYSLVGSPQKAAVIRAAEIGKDAGRTVFFDPGAFNLIRRERNSMDKLLGLTDVLCLNAAEALELAGTSNLNEAVAVLTDLVPLVLVKLGSDGCIISQSGHKRPLRIRGHKVQCVDTTGAGDAFAAAIIFGLSHKLRLRSAAKFANWYAAEKVRNVGGRAFPSETQVAYYLRRIFRNLRFGSSHI